MKDELSELDEIKIAAIIAKARPDLVCRVCADPETETCSLFVGDNLILRLRQDEIEEMDNPSYVSRFLQELNRRSE